MALALDSEISKLCSCSLLRLISLLFTDAVSAMYSMPQDYVFVPAARMRPSARKPLTDLDCRLDPIWYSMD